jgi:phage I-like protein
MVNRATNSYGYWVDVTGIEFEENGTSQWIHAMPLGEWNHPVHGKITFDLARVQRFAANVNAGVRGQDLDIDYDHKALTTEAAGWVKEAKTEVGGTGTGAGLWLLVDWTKGAAQKIKDRAFRYFSPDFQDEWVHPATGQKFRDVLFGGGITNRPFLKNMIPLNLHELCIEDENDSSGGSMNRAFLETAARGYHIEFSEEMSDEELQTKITEAAAVAASQDPNDNDDSNNNSNDDNEDDSGTGEETPPPSDLETQLSEAAKDNPVVALLLAEREQTRKDIADLKADNHKQKVTAQLSELRTGTQQLSPAAEKKLGEAILTGDSTKTLEAVKVILGKGGIVQLGEQGRQGPGSAAGDGDQGEGDATAEFDVAVKKALTEAKNEGRELSELDAIYEVSAANPELYERHRRGSYAQQD